MKIAIIADIHSNLEAFQAVLKNIKKRKIRKIYCAGDIVGYNANPNECIDLVRKNNIISVMGNHDLCCANLKKIEWFNEYGQQAALWQNKIITQKNKQFLLKLPKKIKKDDLFIVHGPPKDELYEYIFPETPPWDLRKFFNLTKKPILIMGHTHIPFIKLLNPKDSKCLEMSGKQSFPEHPKKSKISGNSETKGFRVTPKSKILDESKTFQKKFKNKLVINPGSVGQPRDFNPKASYCILDIKNLKAKIIRVPYNIDIAANKIVKNRLPDFLAKRLFNGM